MYYLLVALLLAFIALFLWGLKYKRQRDRLLVLMILEEAVGSYNGLDICDIIIAARKTLAGHAISATAVARACDELIKQGLIIYDTPHQDDGWGHGPYYRAVLSCSRLSLSDWCHEAPTYRAD